jgi:phosphatidylserine/phosphatidylglycerophosphate/cardiolipin synthase-like enzyme
MLPAGSGNKGSVWLIDRMDAAVGDGVEAAVKARHRRRLRELGWERAIDPGGDGLWAQGDPPPRAGNAIDVLIDGSEALPAIAEAVRNAKRFVHVTGWHLTPGFELDRCEPAVTVGGLLAETAERVPVRVLVWAGAPVPVFHPTRAEVREAVDALTRQTAIRADVDPREHPVHCHHEKTIVVDGEIAFVGGIDLTNLAGDRFDSPGHPARRRLGWHDVATRLRGPVVADVNGHFVMRWRNVTSQEADSAEPPEPAGDSTAQIVRTVAENMYDDVAKGDFRILESYLRALRSAQRLIYLENQFLWAPEIVEVLADKLRRPPSPDFRLVLLLPSKANNGQDDTRGQLGVLADADAGSDRFLATTLQARSGNRTDRVYVHAKVGIVDDRWLTIGSANLNAHSLFNDSELNVVTDDAALARRTRARLWAEHLELDEAAVEAADPTVMVDEHWRPIATEELRRRDAGRPPNHHVLALPGVSRRSGRLLGPLQGLLEDV